MYDLAFNPSGNPFLTDSLKISPVEM